MALKFGKVPIASALDLLLANINATGNGRIDFRSGSVPANLAAAATGTLLATADLVSGMGGGYGATNTTTLIATGQLSGGVFAFENSIIATGTATYFRLFDDGGTARFQGTVTATGGGGDCELSTVSLVIGGTLTITSSTIQITGLD